MPLFDARPEPLAATDADIDCDNDHRCAEHEHEVKVGVQEARLLLVTGDVFWEKHGRGRRQESVFSWQ